MADGSDFQDMLGTSGDQGELRQALQRRLAYYLAAAEDPTAFIATDAATASVTPILLWKSGIFWYDSADTTSAHDGVTVLVSNDGKRYKLAATLNRVSALSVNTAPPGSPAIGDSYLVDTAGTGAFLGHDDDIAHYTAQGWQFEAPQIGLLLYVEDEDAYYHYSEAGVWVAGFGASAIAANSVVPSSVLGGFNRWIVENQTTNAPPGSPTDGVAYIVGGSPTGAWAGHAKDLAIALNSAWIIVDPGDGYEAYDKSAGINYVWSSASTAWVGKGGAYLDILAKQISQTSNLMAEGTSSGGYAASETPPTTTTNRRCIEMFTMPVQASFATQIVEIEYIATVMSSALTVSAGAVDYVTIGFFLDSEANARGWQTVSYLAGARIFANVAFPIGDTSAHTLKIIIFPHAAGGNVTGGNLPVGLRDCRIKYRADASAIAVLIPQATGTRIGTFTAGGGLVVAFDGTKATGAGSCATDAASPGYIGKNYSAASKKIDRVHIWGSNDQGFTDSANNSVTFNLRAKGVGASAPANNTDGTLLGTYALATDASSALQVMIESSDKTTLWDYVFVEMICAGQELYVAEMEFYTPP